MVYCDSAQIHGVDNSLNGYERFTEFSVIITTRTGGLCFISNHRLLCKL